MRVALYHNLPPGGALRVVRQFKDNVPADVVVRAYSLAGPQEQVTSGQAVAGNRREIAQRLRMHRLVGALGLDGAERAVASQINRGSFDVAFVHPCMLSNTPGVLRHLKVPTALYLHEVRRSSFEPSYRTSRPALSVSLAGWALDRAVDRYLGRRDLLASSAADFVMCNSTYTAERVLGCYGRVAEVVPPGVDTDIFRPRSNARAEVPLALSVGGLEPFKNHHFILEAVARIPRAQRPLLGLVYERCDDTYRSQLLRRARELGVHVREFRSIDDDALSTLYATAAVTVVAAQLEPLGLVPLESIACGTPVVAIREAGYRETVTDGVNGILVPRRLDDLTQAILAVLAGRAGLPGREALHETVATSWSSTRSGERQLALLRMLAHGRP